MPSLTPYKHKLADALWNKEFEVSGRVPADVTDTIGSTEPSGLPKPSARSCPDSLTCLFGHIVLQGGEPCIRCRRLTLGDYHNT